MTIYRLDGLLFSILELLFSVLYLFLFSVVSYPVLTVASWLAYRFLKRQVRWYGIYSDDHYIYYCGQESLRRNGVAIMVNRRV